MYKTGAGFMTLCIASTLGDRLVLPLALVLIGALLIAMGKGEK